MTAFRTFLACAAVALAFGSTALHAQDLGLLPKYGSLPKTEAQRAADDKFLVSIDERYSGDRVKAAIEIASRGWQFLQQGDSDDAMRRFNQAWLLNPSNGRALWGMATVEAGSGQMAESLKLFSEAQRTLADNLDFSVDFAKAQGIVGAQSKDSALVDDALARFAQNFDRAPQHVLNLQDWAITLFYVGRYADAWQKIKLAELAPQRAQLDPGFVAALQAKMPRP